MMTIGDFEIKVSLLGAGKTFEQAINNAIEIFVFKSDSDINEDKPEDEEKE